MILDENNESIEYNEPRDKKIERLERDLLILKLEFKHQTNKLVARDKLLNEIQKYFQSRIGSLEIKRENANDDRLKAGYDGAILELSKINSLVKESINQITYPRKDKKDE